MTAEEWQIVWFTAWVSALSTLLILPFGLGMAATDVEELSGLVNSKTAVTITD